MLEALQLAVLERCGLGGNMLPLKLMWACLPAPVHVP
jgi:hypothetical protein